MKMLHELDERKLFLLIKHTLMEYLDTDLQVEEIE
jgi:hypothetical protein